MVWADLSTLSKRRRAASPMPTLRSINLAASVFVFTRFRKSPHAGRNIFRHILVTSKYPLAMPVQHNKVCVACSKFLPLNSQYRAAHETDFFHSSLQMLNSYKQRSDGQPSIGLAWLQAEAKL
tara:strand:- start:707 stop:1075 length:369 start_codon:yes stop_codon:yes gene_type:complete